MRKGGDAYDCMKTELRSYSMISCNQLIYRGEANEQRTHMADFPEITSVRNEVFAGAFFRLPIVKYSDLWGDETVSQCTSYDWPCTLEDMVC